MALSGPTLPPLDGPATQLIVLVHGYGADGHDLISLAPHWQQALPGAAFAAPNAPTRVPGAAGYQWFPIARLDPHEMRKGVEGAAPVLEEFLRAELARLNLTPDRLALVGFSQGTMLSLHVGLTLKPAAIVGFSGLLASPPQAMTSPPQAMTSPPQATKSTPMAGGDGPPIFLSHGDADQVIPAQAMLAAATQLGAAGLAVQWHLVAGMGHSIDPGGLEMAGEFLAQAFGGLLRADAPISCPVGFPPG